MARRTQNERKAQEAARRAECEQARAFWLHQWVCFVGFDGLVKVGQVTEVSEQGTISIDYQLVPGREDAPAILYLTVGQESEVSLRRLHRDKVWARDLNVNATVCYRAGVPPLDGRYASYQVRSQGPYVGIVVDVVTWGVGVRADGWMGDALLYYVAWADILGQVQE